jgi:AcrR family transcriptional regulator
MSAVSERAGVQRNTLYRHFPDERFPAPRVLRALLRHDLATADPGLAELLAEVESYSTTRRLAPVRGDRRVVMPMRLRHSGSTLSLFTTVATVGPGRRHRLRARDRVVLSG